jgi:hypothetical protein
MADISSSASIDRPGTMYLGREYDLATGKALPKPLLFDTADLTTHAICVGMTGSGKTGLCLSLLEEAALNGLPAVAIDPKGDLGNLLLTFPELRPADFRPWIDTSVAAREGITPDQLAEKTADKWRAGLAEWNEDGERVRRFAQAVDRAIYTPGASAGLPLAILKSFAAPPAAVIEDADTFRDRIDAAASGVLALVGVEADPVNSREHILLAKVLEEAWRAGRSLQLGDLIQELQRPPFKSVGVVDLESYFPAKDRHELGMKLNNLLASPTFANWLEGEPLDFQQLLYTAEGKPRLSILSIAHLSDAERMFFVTMVLNEAISWMRSQPGTGSLRAVLYMDEVFGYFPPTANPPSKRPMLTLMKQARAFGLGCVLATQNPVDLDYKGLSNAGAWFLGRLQTERDKKRVIEGLEGASSESGASFDRAEMERSLASLDNRVFVLNNVHAKAPEVFHSRWALSYLAGPLTRTQIAKLMADRKPATKGKTDPESPSAAAPSTKDLSAAQAAPSASSRPVVSSEITERFWPVDGDGGGKDGERLVYRPGLLGVGRVHFIKASSNVDVWRDVAAVQPVYGELAKPTWNTAMLFEKKPSLADGPQAQAAFDELPGELAQAKNYRRWDNDLVDHLYQHERLVLWQCAEPELQSTPDESEKEFRARAAKAAAEQLTARQREVRGKYAGRLQKAEEPVRRAQARAAAEKSQYWMRQFSMLCRISEIALTIFACGRSRKKWVTTTSAGAAMRERQQQGRAQDQLAGAQADFEKVQAELQAELDGLQSAVRPETLQLEKLEIPPRKADIKADEVSLVWLPWWVADNGASRPAY